MVHCCSIHCFESGNFLLMSYDTLLSFLSMGKPMEVQLAVKLNVVTE